MELPAITSMSVENRRTIVISMQRVLIQTDPLTVLVALVSTETDLLAQISTSVQLAISMTVIKTAKVPVTTQLVALFAVAATAMSSIQV